MLDETDYRLMNSKSYKNQKKLDDEIATLKVKCKHCGHTMPIVFTDRTICTHCGYWVYKTPQLEFEYKLKEKMK